MLLCGDETSAPSLHGTRLALTIAQQLSAISRPPRVLVLTYGALAADGAHAASDVAHGGAWGFGRVLRLEHAALHASSTDVMRGASTAALRSLAGPSKEDEVAWRGEMRYAARLRASVMTAMRFTALARGSYAITGGLGGLGLRAATMLMANGAAGVTLSSRSGDVGRDGQGLKARLASLGAAAQVMTSDVGDCPDAFSLLAHGSFVGVLHAAGVLRDKMLRAMTDEDVNGSLSPKAIAASHAHRVTAPAPLEALGLFSSVASLLDSDPHHHIHGHRSLRAGVEK